MTPHDTQTEALRATRDAQDDALLQEDAGRPVQAETTQALTDSGRTASEGVALTVATPTLRPATRPVAPTAVYPCNVQAQEERLVQELRTLFDISAQAFDAGQLSDAHEREIKQLLNNANPHRRRITERDLGLLIGRTLRLIEAIRGDVTTTDLVSFAKSSKPAPRTHATHPAVPDRLAISELPASADLLKRLREGNASKDEWLEAMKPVERTPRAPVSVSAAITMQPSEKNSRIKAVAQFAVCRASGMSVGDAMRKIVQEEKLTPAQRKQSERWEETLRTDGKIADTAAGQRTFYRIVPLIELLLLEGYYGRRGATGAAIYTRMVSELRQLRPRALDAGIALTLKNDTTAHALGLADTQLTLGATALTKVTLPIPHKRTVNIYLTRLPDRGKEVRQFGVAWLRQQRRIVDAYTRAIRPHQRAFVDHTEIDLVVAERTGNTPGTYTYEVKRVWLTVLMDEFTRMILGFYLWYETPTSMTTSLLLYRSLTPWPRIGRADCWIPERVRMDLGSDFQSKHVSRVLDGLNVTRENCRPARGDDKAALERFYGTVRDALSGFPGYTKGPGGSREKASRQPERLLTFTRLHEEIEQVVRRHNTTRHGLQLTTPAEAYRATPAREVPTDGDLIFRLMKSDDSRKLRRGGVRLFNTDYLGDVTDPRGRTMFELSQMKVRVYYMPENMKQIHVTTLSNDGGPEEYIGVMYAPSEELPRVSLEEQSAAPMKALNKIAQVFTRSAHAVDRDRAKRDHDDVQRDMATLQAARADFAPPETGTRLLNAPVSTTEDTGAPSALANRYLQKFAALTSTTDGAHATVDHTITR